MVAILKSPESTKKLERVTSVTFLKLMNNSVLKTIKTVWKPEPNYSP